MAENKWVARVITPISGVTTLLATGRGPSCRDDNYFPPKIGDLKSQGKEEHPVGLMFWGIQDQNPLLEDVAWIWPRIQVEIDGNFI